ncbi:hypothetical protein [Sphingomonas sp.]|uniref:hypothetical protein n=1 Tax=Sphingomonas sp. TaxID=28214 RepID=UPI002DF0853B|nr:hypothetical protein [Sphingomonas sp.]
MRIICGAALLMAACPAAAQSVDKVAEEAVMTPAEDVNVKKREIPPVLLSAAEDPYSREGTRTCTQLNVAIAELDTALGPDFDSGEGRKTGLDATKVAKSVVGSFIPFRGVIREVTGAAGAQRRYNAAVDAGLARRGYLRGIAQARRCKPAAMKVAASS